MVLFITGSHKVKMKVLVAQSCLTLCDAMDCSLPGSFVHGIVQARILEWVAIPLSRISSWPRDWTLSLLHYRHILYHLISQGSPSNNKPRVNIHKQPITAKFCSELGKCTRIIVKDLLSLSNSTSSGHLKNSHSIYTSDIIDQECACCRILRKGHRDPV